MSDAHRETDHLAHLEALEQAYSRLLETHGFDGVLIYSGHPHYHFGDDQQASFATYAHFLHWVPLPGISHSWLMIRPSEAPRLYFHAPRDYWHLSPVIPQGAWTRRFIIEEVATQQPPSGKLPGRFAIIGDVSAEVAAQLGGEWNPADLIRGLDELRIYKSDYETDCLREANRLALAGHRAAYEAFQTGGAELDIQLAYLAASRQRESHVPYQNIVALNSHGGVLHYQHYDLTPPTQYYSLLVDAGRTVSGYAADITRTWAGRDADPQFSELIAGVEALKRKLIDSIRPGESWVQLHHSMHQQLGELLVDQGILHCSAEAAVDMGVTRAFCPHGLGHLLGLQVHDVAGRQNAQGKPLPPPDNDPALRLTRQLERGMVVTVEPGLYFIPMLLEPLRDSPAGRDISWPCIERLAPHGGIRTEDNILVTQNGSDNLTRV